MVALHFGGRFHDINYGVPACELAKDGRVVDVGVKFAGPAIGGQPPWQKWWDSADEACAIPAATEDAGRPGRWRYELTRRAPLADTSAIKVTPDRRLQLLAALVVTVSPGAAGKQPVTHGVSSGCEAAVKGREHHSIARLAWKCGEGRTGSRSRTRRSAGARFLWDGCAGRRWPGSGGE